MKSLYMIMQVCITIHKLIYISIYIYVYIYTERENNVYVVLGPPLDRLGLQVALTCRKYGHMDI